MQTSCVAPSGSQRRFGTLAIARHDSSKRISWYLGRWRGLDSPGRDRVHTTEPGQRRACLCKAPAKSRVTRESAHGRATSLLALCELQAYKHELANAKSEAQARFDTLQHELERLVMQAESDSASKETLTSELHHLQFSHEKVLLCVLTL